MSFRQRTYHANYNEPRLSSRDQLLDASYRSAIAQCQKAGIATETQPFILEDTSVRIDALSTAGTEVPGLDIKYWMRGMTFARLDSLLKEAGNIRRVTVRSDVLLHVPPKYRGAWKSNEDYLVFKGEQDGTVAEVESSFDTNLVYPWLDNETFNRWFVPDGASGPLGSLGIEEADKYDFRRNSFAGLIKFLGQVRLLEAEPVQSMLPLDQAPNYILCGYTCAGKTVASQRLAHKFGYEHVEASDFMYMSYYYRHGYQSRVSIGDFAEQALEEKPEIAAERVAQYIEKHLSLPIVISGFRALTEVHWLRKALAYSGRRFELVFVEATRSERFRRLGARGREGDDVAYGRFVERDEQQARMGLEDVRTANDAVRWENVGTLEEYYRVVEGDVALAVSGRIGFSEAEDVLRQLLEVKLEEAILVALLGVWSDEGEREYYTTNEVASLINEVFPGVRPKHKDNVSRYFNQDFYPYYDISSRGGVRRYRLSNTGFGRALLAMDELICGRSAMAAKRGRVEGQRRRGGKDVEVVGAGQQLRFDFGFAW